MCVGTPGDIPKHMSRTSTNYININNNNNIIWFHVMLLDCDWFILALLVYIPPDLLVAWFLYHITWHSCTWTWRNVCGAKCHTEQSIIPQTWWRPPLESHIASSMHLLYHCYWSDSLFMLPSTYMMCGAQCHTEQSVTLHAWWRPPLGPVGVPLGSHITSSVH